MNEDMQERRRHKRYSTDNLDLTSKMVLASYVKILDISIGGVSFKADRRLNIGREYTLKIAGKNKEITVKGIIVRSSLVESKKDARGNVIPIYIAGMQFTDITEDKLKEIESFIKNNVVESDRHIELHSSSGKRLFVRVFIETKDHGSQIKIPETCNIKNISLGGMLLECPCSLKNNEIIPLEILISEDKKLKTNGRIVESEPIASGNYNVRVEFQEISAQDKNILNEFINRLENETS